MPLIRLQSAHDFEEWRVAARALLRAGVPPEAVTWITPEDGADLFAADPPAARLPRIGAAGVVPRRFLSLARQAIHGSGPDRHALAYRLLWRLQKDKTILSRPWDVDVGKLTRRTQSAKKALARRNLPAPAAISQRSRDVAEDLMQRVEPASHLRGRRRPDPEIEAETAIETAEIISLADARAQVQGCRRCPLYQFATQAVFGEGPQSATIMFVGEQPGDQEDLAGKPFVGPAGRVLDATMQKVGIPRKEVYVTNAVKHFKFTPRGKKRIHKRPDRGEIVACKFWLNLEREFIRPRVVVAMGATAATSLLDKTVTISALRGEPIAIEDGSTLFVTIHPSYLLRLRTGGPGATADIAAEQRRFEADLEQIWRFAQTHDRPARRAS
jgi:uracil-DNA glycosylase family protein